ncbi:MAG: PHP domain-containing protein [Muricomes sp.]
MVQLVYACDLHTHTTRSDGGETPMEVICQAALRGLRVLAITDHDIVPEEIWTDKNRKEINLREYAKSVHVNLLLGMEVSCETEVEDVHIICLGCDWKYFWFKELETMVAKSRADGYKRLVERLREDGMDITWEEVLDNGGHPVEEAHVLKKMIFELMAGKGFSKNWREAKLLVKNTEKYQIKRQKPDPKEVIREVHQSGGIAILAHPLLISDSVEVNGRRMSRKEYIDELVEAGLDGIEACYTYDKTSYEGTMTKKEAEKYIRDNYSDKVEIMSGGSDYHADGRKGVVNAREPGECGVTTAYFYGNRLLAGLLDKK